MTQQKTAMIVNTKSGARTADEMPSETILVTSTADSNENEESSPATKSFPTKPVVGVLFLALIVYIVIDSFTTKHVTGAVQIFLEWFENNVVAGAFLFIVGSCKAPFAGHWSHFHLVVQSMQSAQFFSSREVSSLSALDSSSRPL